MVNLFNNVYKGKKVLVTGHTGFKGSWLTLWLKELGAEVLGYSLEPNTAPNLFSICNIDKNITSIFDNICNSDRLETEISCFKPDIIFHLAAQPLVRKSYKEPKKTYETNLLGTLNIYEAARKCNSVKAIVTITTDKCYENKEWIYGYRENDPMGGYDPYSSSKACVELLTNSYRSSFFNELGIGVATARAGNVIGGGDWAEDRIIPDFVRSVSEGKTLFIRNPSAIRPWQHVLEPLSGYLWLGSLLLQGKKEYSNAWNFGPSDSDIISVENILQLAINIWGMGQYEIDNSNKPHEANLLKLDISKAKCELKWSSVYNVESAISKTIQWYKNYYNNNEVTMEEFSINQIREYIDSASNKSILWVGNNG